MRRVAAHKDQHDERVKNCNAYLVYKEAESVGKAIEELDNAVFLGNHLRLDKIVGKKNFLEPKRSVFVGGVVVEAQNE